MPVGTEDALTLSAGRSLETEAAVSEKASTARRLRLGLFVDSPLQPHWIAEAFQKVASSAIAEVTVFACDETRQRETSRLWRLYGSIDARCFGADSNIWELSDLRTQIAAHHSVRLCRDGSLPSRAFVASLRLDVAFVVGDLHPALLEGLAQHGVWRYCFGGDGRGTPDSAGFPETLGGLPLTCCGLAVRFGTGEERILYRSWSRTHPFSVARTRQNVFLKCAEFPIRALTSLHRTGRVAVTGGGWDIGADSIQVPAGTAASVAAISRLGARLARRALQKLLYVDQWFLAYRFGSGERWESDLRQYRRLMPPKDRFWADPFAVHRNGRYFIFFEDLPFASGKGHISMVEVRRDGTTSPPVRVLERDYHLSYPFLMELGGQLYMVPETLQNRSVELYRCIDFPTRWRLERQLMRDARFADATLHQADGRWWMFVNIGFPGAEAYDELHLFHAERLEGHWQAHPDNPVKSDARSARPAGKLFRRNGILYRPAQICAPLYGSGVSVNRVLHLSRHTYAESEEERIVPAAASGILGLHTVNRAGDLAVIDGFTRRSRL
ncbi:MAG: glucosamine inositolphosphorylceramide transferase family protein [Betaproteobacteria bacterium]